MPAISNIAIIGSGNVAQYLGRVLSKHFHVHFFARRPGETYHPIEELKGFSSRPDFILLCVSDGAIREVSAALPPASALIAHVSGATDLAEIHPKHQRRAVFYPLMSIRHNSDIDPREIPFCLEAENENDLPMLAEIAETLGASHHNVSSEQRTWLHIAAVISQNFSNHLYHKSKGILQEQGLDFEILLPLLRHSLEKLENHDPKDMQTGPAVRNDLQTIEKHLNLIEDESTHEIYRVLSESIQKTYDKKL